MVDKIKVQLETIGPLLGFDFSISGHTPGTKAMALPYRKRPRQKHCYSAVQWWSAVIMMLLSALQEAEGFPICRIFKER